MTQPESDELLPCPFCGGKPQVTNGCQGTRYILTVACEECGAEVSGTLSPFNDSEMIVSGDADIRWNTRAQPTKQITADKIIPDIIETLKYVLEDIKNNDGKLEQDTIEIVESAYEGLNSNRHLWR